MLAWINWLRALAILQVIAIHSSHTFLRNRSPSMDWQWMVTVMIMTASRICVPIFVMISGYLTIAKYKGWLDFCGKKLVRVIVPFVVWWLVYRFTRSYDYHFWFIYMIVPLYLLAPMFVWITKNIDKRILWLLIVVLFISKAGGYAGYFLMGYCLAGQKFSVWRGLGLIFVIFIGLCWMVIRSSFLLGATVEVYWDYLNPWAVLLSAVTFSFFSNIDWPKNKLMDSLAENSYGIYLIHLLFLERLLPNPPIILFLSTLALSWMIIFLLKKLPGGSFLVG